MASTILLYIGAVLLTLLSFQDFKDRVLKSSSTISYYLCFFLFIFLNIVVYFAICSVAMEVDTFNLLTGNITNPDSMQKQILPLIISFAYFGVGTVKIPIGGKAVSFYSTVLNVFQGMFRFNDVDMEPLKKEIDKIDSETESLNEAIELFMKKGEKSEWDILKEQWNELNKVNIDNNNHIISLQEISEKLSKPNITKETINYISTEIAKKVNQMKKDIIDRLRKHIINLVVANDKNHSAIEYLLSKFGLGLPTFSSSNQFLIRLNRSWVISLFSGIFIGSIKVHFGNLPDDTPAIYEIFRWTIAIGIFGTLFSIVALIEKGKSFKVIALGGISGILAHLILRILGVILGITPMSMQEFLEWTPNLLIGGSFGASLALMTHVFQHYLRHRIRNLWVAYLAMGTSGACLFVILAWIEKVADFKDFTTAALMAVIGFSITLTVAIVTNIFHEK